MNVGFSLNETLSLWNMEYGGLVKRMSSSLTLLAKVMATRKMTFIDKWDSEQIAYSSNSDSVNIKRTKLRSHVEAGFVTGGKFLTSSFRKHSVMGWVKMEWLSIEG